MKSILVIGLGRFGRNLSMNLTKLGVKVTAIDKDEEKVVRITSRVTKALIGDCTDRSVLQSLKVGGYDKCFVCISGNVQSSLEITTQLKELGALCVISKTDRDVHSKFLMKAGADEVIYIERESAQRTAIKYSVNNAFEYIELTDDYAVSEMLVPEEWAGRSIEALDIRSRFRINVIGIKSGDKMVPVTDPGRVLARQEHIVVAGNKKDMLSVLDK